MQTMRVALKAIKESGIQLKGDAMIGTVVDEEAGRYGNTRSSCKGISGRWMFDNRANAFRYCSTM